MDKLDSALKIGNIVLNSKLENKIAEYVPYGLDSKHPSDWQVRFHKLGATHYQRLLCAALRIGKTHSGCAEDTYHLTGKYPDWWEGHRFDRPIKLWAAGISNEKTRDALQSFLFGNPADPSAFGTGAIPKSCLDYGRVIKKAQVPNAYQSVPVKHVSGRWSTCVLKAYEQKAKAFMSEEVDVIHLDEEPKRDIMSQCLVRGKLLYMTFTPESGMTEVVSQFFNDIKPEYQALIQAGWDDAPHLTKEWKEARIATLLPFERDAKTKGIPLLGSGMVFPIADEEIMCDAFDIPSHYFLIAGLDFGSWNWPTAGAWLAWDRENDVVYVYGTYKAQEKSIPVHAAAVNARGRHIPVMYPHDAEKGDRSTGIKLAQQYRDMGCNMHYMHFTNPPADGEEEGKGGNAVDAGLIEMFTRMQSGRLKVFSNLVDWFKEKQMFHTNDKGLVRKYNDIMDATRYAIMSLRHARPKVRTFGRPVMVDSRFSALDALLN